MPSRSIRTPLGWISLTEEDGAITALSWRRSEADESELLAEAERQLAAYFDRRLQSFDLPLRPKGDALALAVADAMRTIPFGRTREYGESPAPSTPIPGTSAPPAAGTPSRSWFPATASSAPRGSAASRHRAASRPRSPSFATKAPIRCCFDGRPGLTGGGPPPSCPGSPAGRDR